MQPRPLQAAAWAPGSGWQSTRVAASSRRVQPAGSATQPSSPSSVLASLSSEEAVLRPYGPKDERVDQRRGASYEVDLRIEDVHASGGVGRDRLDIAQHPVQAAWTKSAAGLDISQSLPPLELALKTAVVRLRLPETAASWAWASANSPSTRLVFTGVWCHNTAHGGTGYI